MCCHVSLDQFIPVLLAYVVGFSFFSTKPRDWLGTEKTYWFYMVKNYTRPHRVKIIGC